MAYSLRSPGSSVIPDAHLPSRRRRQVYCNAQRYYHCVRRTRSLYSATFAGQNRYCRRPCSQPAHRYLAMTNLRRGHYASQKRFFLAPLHTSRSAPLYLSFSVRALTVCVCALARAQVVRIIFSSVGFLTFPFKDVAATLPPAHRRLTTITTTTTRTHGLQRATLPV